MALKYSVYIRSETDRVTVEAEKKVINQHTSNVIP